VERLLPKDMLRTRNGTIAVGVGALVLATLLLLVYLRSYRSSVNSSSGPATVLVAKRFIPKGTTSAALAKSGLFQVTAIPKGELKEGAVSDPAVLQGEVAVNDVYPGQQLTIADFGVTTTSGALSAELSGSWRAIAISLDATHGIIPQAQTGDRVDVYAQSNGAMGLVVANVLVLQAPNQSASASGAEAPTSGNYIFRVPTGDAARLAYAAQNIPIWLALRPQNAAPTRPALVTSSNVIGAS
jgi:Flp pilus assembly protein CpaB